MVASPKMAKMMRSVWGGEYEFVMNCCDYVPYIRHQKNELLKVVYTGGLTLERYRVLNRVASCINEINMSDRKFEMHIYAPNSHIDAYMKFMEPEVVFHESVTHEDVDSILRSSDVLIHVESFNDNIIRFTEFSLSTKIPEYLASGIPVIYYGPSNIGVGEFLTDHNIGVRVTDDDEFMDQLGLLYSNDMYYESIARHAFNVGYQLFEKNRMRLRMHECISKKLI
ncbi:MAG: glycosyltransferase [Armatimonadota bacterium]